MWNNIFTFFIVKSFIKQAHMANSVCICSVFAVMESNPVNLVGLMSTSIRRILRRFNVCLFIPHCRKVARKRRQRLTTIASSDRGCILPRERLIRESVGGCCSCTCCRWGDVHYGTAIFRLYKGRCTERSPVYLRIGRRLRTKGRLRDRSQTTVDHERDPGAMKTVGGCLLEETEREKKRDY